MKWIERQDGGWDLIDGADVLASAYADKDGGYWCVQGNLVDLMGFDVVNNTLKVMGYHLGINDTDSLESAQDIAFKVVQRIKKMMNKNSAELFSVLENVVVELDKCDCLVRTKQIVEPLRKYVIAGCHVGNSNLNYHKKLEWYAGQLLKIVDNEAWHVMNATLNFFDVIKTLEKENQ